MVAERADALSAFKTAHGLSAPTVLFVSRLDPNNRIDVLIDAANRLRTQGVEIRCVLIGSGPDLAAIKRQVRRLDLDDEVTLVPGVYDEKELARWFLSADVFCYPSNAGLSLLHAFSYGLPVVAGDDRSRHNPEIYAVRDRENGLLFAHNSAPALADTLRVVFTDSQLRHRLHLGALSTARDYSVTKMVDGLETAVLAANERRLSR